MGKYTQKQKTDAEHCIRSQSQQQQEGDHMPDALEQQIEKWMGEEGVTMEDLIQTYRTENERGGKDSGPNTSDRNYQRR